MHQSSENHTHCIIKTTESINICCHCLASFSCSLIFLTSITVEQTTRGAHAEQLRRNEIDSKCCCRSCNIGFGMSSRSKISDLAMEFGIKEDITLVNNVIN